MQTLNDVREKVHQLLEELASAGDTEAANRLRIALTDFYTTSTESLIGIDAALAETKASWTGFLSKQRQLEVAHLQRTVRQLMNLR